MTPSGEIALERIVAAPDDPIQNLPAVSKVRENQFFAISTSLKTA